MVAKKTEAFIGIFRGREDIGEKNKGVYDGLVHVNEFPAVLIRNLLMNKQDSHSGIILNKVFAAM